jgi:hypothetical protein
MREKPGRNVSVSGVHRARPLRVKWSMTNRARLLAAVLMTLAATSLAACSSGASRPSWCAPLITQFHAHETRQAYLSGLTAVQGQGAPAGQLIADETAYAQDEADANGTGADSFAALADAPKALAKVSGDLKALNAECGQAGDAYKSDNAW